MGILDLALLRNPAAARTGARVGWSRFASPGATGGSRRPWVHWTHQLPVLQPWVVTAVGARRAYSCPAPASTPPSAPPHVPEAVGGEGDAAGPIPSRPGEAPSRSSRSSSASSSRAPWARDRAGGAAEGPVDWTPRLELLQACITLPPGPLDPATAASPPAPDTPKSKSFSTTTSRWSHPYLAPGTFKALELCIRAQLAPAGTGKNVVLACPHPGSTTLLEHTGRRVAKRLGAAFLALDHQTLLRVAADGSAPTSAHAGSHEPMTAHTAVIRGEAVVLTDAFPLAPSYAVDAWEAQDAMRQEPEDAEEGEGEEASSTDHSPSALGPGSLPSAKHTSSAMALLASLFGKDRGSQGFGGGSTSSAPQPLHVALHLNPARAGEAGEVGPEGEAAPHALFRVEAGRRPGEGGQSHHASYPFAKGSLYDIRLPAARLGRITGALERFLAERVPPTTPLLLFVRDATDMLEAGGADGKRLFAALTNFVSHARNQGRPVLLVAGCSPGLADPDGLCPEAEHYRSVFDLEADSYMWEEGRFFQTPLDLLPDRFTRVEIFPPAPALRGNTARAGEMFDAWLEEMHRDQGARVARLNWGAAQALAQRRRLLPGTEWMPLPHDLPSEPLHFLATALLTRAAVERWVDVAYGQCLEVGAASLAPEHLRVGLQLLMVQSLAHLPRSAAGGREGGEGKAALTISPALPGEEGAEAEDGAAGTVRKLAQPRAPPPVLSKAQLFRTLGPKLNAYEKKLFGTVVDPASIQTTFSDLVLPPSSKLLLQTLISLPLKRPEFFAKGVLAKHSIHGCLLFGPPGTGKTMLAKAIAKSSGARFMCVALSDIFDKYVGEGEKNIKAVFSLARKLSPCIVFLDEVDAAFSSRRADGLNSSKREIINEFMSEWDGLQSNNSGVIIMGATNRPFDLDDAILRRMPRRVLIDMPNQEQRKQILALLLREEGLDASVDLDALASRTQSYSGSDLKHVCVAAAFSRIKEAIVTEAMTAEAATAAVATTPATANADTSATAIATTPGAPPSAEEVAERISKLEDWSALPMATEGQAREALPEGEGVETPPQDAHARLGPLCARHFDLALREVPTSLTDETLTMAELRKWDALYGDGATARKRQRPGWGFAPSAPDSDTASTSLPVP